MLIKRENALDLYSLPDDMPDAGSILEKKLTLLNTLTRQEFDQAEKLIDARLQNAMGSLSQSAAAIEMLLAAQTPADLATEAGIAMRNELEALRASSTHLTRLATLMQHGFSDGRKAHEKRTDIEIAKVVDAVSKHRTVVQDNAIALTEAALDKARSPSPLSHASRTAERRPR